MAFLPSNGLCRTLPWAGLASLVLPWAGGEFIKNFDPLALGSDPRFVDILVIAVIVFALTMVLTAAVGCWVVRVMKGPEFKGDTFPADRAEETRTTGTE